MRFFSGFGFVGEEQLFSHFLRGGKYDIAGFSYGAQKAIKSALQGKRVQNLTLLSPAFFQDKSAAFKRAQLLLFRRDEERYNDEFLKSCVGFAEQSEESKREIVALLMRANSDVLNKASALLDVSQKGFVDSSKGCEIFKQSEDSSRAQESIYENPSSRIQAQESTHQKIKELKNPRDQESTRTMLTRIAPYFVGGGAHELEQLLDYEWRADDFLELYERGVEIEIFLGGRDKVVDSLGALRFFRTLPVRIFWIKNGNHLLLF